MIAMSILSITMVSIYKLQGQSVYMLTSVRFYTLAPLLAREKMSECETMEWDDVSSSSGGFDDFPDINWESLVEEVEFEMDVESDSKYIRYKDILKKFKTVEILITTDNMMHQYSLKGYLVPDVKDD